MTSVDGELSTGKPSAVSYHIPGEPGLWFFLSAELTVFAVLFVVFMYQRAADLNTFNQESLDLGVWRGVTSTLVLVTGSFFAAQAIENYRNASWITARRFLKLAM